MKAPMVVRPVDGGYAVTVGKGETVHKFGRSFRQAALQAARDTAGNEYRPGSIMTSIDGYASTFYENPNYWKLEMWTDEHPAPIVIAPTDDKDWSVKRGSFKTVDTRQWKHDATSLAESYVDEHELPGIVYYYEDGTYNEFDADLAYWDRWA